MADNVCTVRVFSKLAKAAIEEESIPLKEELLQEHRFLISFQLNF